MNGNEIELVPRSVVTLLTVLCTYVDKSAHYTCNANVNSASAC